MTAAKLHNGAWYVADIVNGYLTSRTFYGYSKRDALRAFKREMRGANPPRTGYSTKAQP
jgi:hypothetical protein